MSERFHRAARDGLLSVLKEATRRDCNAPDEDGLTPTTWAAYEGNLEALRLLVSRGGDPNNCDHYGNTALHCAAARGRMPCVAFLVNFGACLWSLDNEHHTAKDLAAINNKEEVLRYLDSMMAKEELKDSKQVKKTQEKAIRDADKRMKDVEKIHKKAAKKRAEEEKKLNKEKEKKMVREDENNQPAPEKKKSFMNSISGGSLPFIAGYKKDSKGLRNSPRFSELTTASANNKKAVMGIQRKILKKKVLQENRVNASHFKVRETEDGVKSVKSIAGFMRDSEILFVPNGSLSSTDSESSTCNKRGRLSNVFETGSSKNNMVRTQSVPDFAQSGHQGSLFERPGFGSVAFRNSISATLGSLGSDSIQPSSSGSEVPLDPWEEKVLQSDDEEETAPVYLFLAGIGLEDFIPHFYKEHIDIEALILLTEEDLVNLSIPLGPRRKLLKAISDRKNALSDPGEVVDSRL